MANSRGDDSAPTSAYKRAGIIRAGSMLVRSINDELLRIEQAFRRFNKEVWQVRWDDLRAPSSLLKPNAARPPGVEATHGTWLFDKNKTETVTHVFQMPHTWKEGTTLRPHVHWMKTSNAGGDVMWEVQYKIVAVGGVRPTSFTVASGTTAIGDDNTLGRHLITDLPDITMAGYTISTIIFVQVSRIGGDAADTYAADAELLEFDLHYERDSNGSKQEFHKK